TTQLGITHRLSNTANLQLKNSYSLFDRRIAIPAYRFDAKQQSSFTELTWNSNRKKAQWIVGANVLTDDLAEDPAGSAPLRDYQFNTVGVFVQNTWSVSERMTLETGLRGDHVSKYGFELLPRVSALFRLSPSLTTRIGGGAGYKTPTVFTEEAERIQFRNVFPIDIAKTEHERSLGGNWDIHYRARIGELGFSLNQLFFYTRLNKPLVRVGAPGGKVAFVNGDGYIDTRGAETNLRLLYGHFKLFVGYTYTDAHTQFGGIKSWLPLTARHRLNNVLMYEIEDRLKLGLEAYYFSRQQLGDGSLGKPYWITGFMAERLWETFSVFLNFENFTNTRQTKFDTIYTGSIDNPVFRDIYAPVEGFVVNGGIKIRL
ncbi:MAG TPA: TonB-dependent receptor, partial [Flavisolibacter sp.]